MSLDVNFDPPATEPELSRFFKIDAVDLSGTKAGDRGVGCLRPVDRRGRGDLIKIEIQRSGLTSGKPMDA